MSFPRFSVTIDQRFLIVVFLLFIVVATSLATYLGWIRGADHRDFYPRWAGARRVLLGSKDLYSIEATQEMQITLYGQIIPPDRDQQGFAYPALILPIILPFALIEDVEVATALWEGISVALIILGLLLVQSKYSSHSISPIVLSIFWFFTLLMVFQGQITGLVIAVLCSGYWALHNNRDLLGGLLISIGLVKPELAILPILVLIILSLKKRQFLFLIGFIFGFMALFVISIYLVGLWIPDWLDAIIRYAQYAQVVWPISYVFRLSPWFGIILGFVLVIGAVWIREDQDHLFAISIPLQIVFFPQTLIWGLSIHIIPMNIVWQRRNTIPVIILWALGWLTILGNFLSSDWWKIQLIFISICVFLLVIYSHVRNPLDPSKEINTPNSITHWSESSVQHENEVK